MFFDIAYIIPITAISLSITCACCIFCVIPYKNKNNDDILPLYTHERNNLTEVATNPPPYSEI
jgi:hypothetical protein